MKYNTVVESRFKTTPFLALLICILAPSASSLPSPQVSLHQQRRPAAWHPLPPLVRSWTGHSPQPAPPPCSPRPSDARSCGGRAGRPLHCDWARPECGRRKGRSILLFLLFLPSFFFFASACNHWVSTLMPPSWCPALLSSGAEDWHSPPPPPPPPLLTSITRPLLDAATATLWPLTPSERAASLAVTAERVQHYRNGAPTRHSLNESALFHIALIFDS